MEKTTVSRNQLVNQLLRIGHGNLDIYKDISLQAIKEEPELFAHFIAWNHIKGQVRDSKVAFPVLALRGPSDAELYGNAAAHLCLLDPRNLVRAVMFHKELSKNGSPLKDGAGKMLNFAVNEYLRVREKNAPWWIRTVLQHRKSMKSLYALFHRRPTGMAQAILFDREKPAGTPFEAVARLKTMSPEEAAGTILNHKIPFLVATGALGGIKGKTDIILALIERMSGNEVIGNTVTLEKWGVFESPILKAAYDAAVERAKKDKKVSTLKAGKAIEKAGKKATPKMKALQEEKLSQLGGIDGDWLVLGDRSGSMSLTIEMARFTASLIAQQVKGKVYLIFFNTEPQRYDVTGLTFEQIKTMTARVTATGGTAIGCGVDLIRELGIVVNGIVICSDGGDNTRPLFHEAYRKYAEQMGIEPTVYHFWVPGESNVLTRYCATGNIPAQMFDMSKDMDYYSLPNIIPTLRSNRYTLYDEIMGIPLLTISQALERTAK